MTNMYHQSGSSPAATLLMRVRTSGRCPPSLIGEDRVTRGDDFEAIALRTLEGGASQGLRLRSDGDAVESFELALKVRIECG
mmetsp:Transcript_32872/g.48303  ORF Transcript_32872/g.48303 Transcript_32872/m.48303 type:complete len:82 (+) Transcript_32872:49-294(+)